MRKIWMFIALFCAAITATIGKPTSGTSCEDIDCKAGRECKVLDDGSSACVCVKDCPKHAHPVCGSNNRTYVNHCYLHREACLSHQHILVKHKGDCKTGNIQATKEHHKPVACFRHERDQLRKRIISWLQSQMKSKDIARWTSSYNELVFANFYTCDIDKNSYLDANEFLDCIKNNISVIDIISGEHVDLLRALCIDEIISLADGDHDWKLNITEFLKCMDPEYKAVDKYCSLEQNTYRDGEEIAVNCSQCACACGSWVCTSTRCQFDNIQNETQTDNQNRIVDSLSNEGTVSLQDFT